MRSSAICSCEWLRRSSTKGGCFVIVIIIFNLRHTQLIVSFFCKDEKTGKKFHGLQLLLRNVSQGMGNGAKRLKFGRKSWKMNISGGGPNWMGRRGRSVLAWTRAWAAKGGGCLAGQTRNFPNYRVLL